MRDLIRLDGLKKPDQDIWRVELRAKDDRLKELKKDLSSFAEEIERQSDVGAAEVTVLAESMKRAMFRQLHPEESVVFLGILRQRFSENLKLHEGISWQDVYDRLSASPEKLSSLHQMEETKGEPDVVGFDKKTGEYIFMDCSKESPEGRRNCVYDKEAGDYLRKSKPEAIWNRTAVGMAAYMGIEMLNREQYQYLQGLGEFDKQSRSWLKTPVEDRKMNLALYGTREVWNVLIRDLFPHTHHLRRAWRGIIYI